MLQMSLNCGIYFLIVGKVLGSPGLLLCEHQRQQQWWKNLENGSLLLFFSRDYAPQILAWVNMEMPGDLLRI